MIRRWRNLKPPRGRYWTGYEKSVIPAYPPPYVRQAGSSPRWAAKLARSHGRWYDPGWGQANQGQAWPSFTRQGSTQDRFYRLPRGHRFDPPWTPPSTIPPPQWLRQAGPLRTPARLCPSRRRWNDPGWGQANQGTAHQQWLRQAGPSPRYGARLNRSQGRRFDLPYPPSVAVVVPVAPPTGGGKSMLSRYMRWADL